LSLVSGVFYGQMFTPAIYVQDNYTGVSTDGKYFLCVCMNISCKDVLLCTVTLFWTHV